MAYQFPMMRARQQIDNTRQVESANQLRALQMKKAAMGIQDIELKKQKKAELDKYVSQEMEKDPSQNRELLMYNKMIETGDADGVKQYIDTKSKIVKNMMELDPKGGFGLMQKFFGVKGKYTGNKIELDLGDRIALIDPKYPKDAEISFKKGKKPDDKTTKADSDLKLENDLTNKIITDEGLSEIEARIKAKNKISKGVKGSVASALKQQLDELDVIIKERNNLIKGGADPDSEEVGGIDKKIDAYEYKLSGIDADMADLTDDQIRVLAGVFLTTGKMIPLGRGKASAKVRVRIAKMAAEMAIEQQKSIDKTETADPYRAVLEMISKQSDTKAITKSISDLTGQLNMMDAFVGNIGNQIARYAELAKEIKTFDASLLNVPLRLLRSKVVGTPLQNKLDLYLTEISNESARLSAGNVKSIAELSATAQEKWARIHDDKLSIAKQNDLLNESYHAANMRMAEFESTLQFARKRLKSVDRNQVIRDGKDKNKDPLGIR